MTSKRFIGSQLRSSSYHVKLFECFKVPSDLADPIPAPPTCHWNHSDDEDDPDTPPPSPPSLPDIPDVISAIVHLLFDKPQPETPPILAFRAAPIIDFAATQSSCPGDIPFEKAVTSADPPPPNPRRCSRVRRPPTRMNWTLKFI